MCDECYADNNRITPLLKPVECLENHIQYICGSCGRCICIQKDPKRGLQRWNFPFKSLDIAKLYLRTADFTMKKSCGIYEIKNESGRVSYKIFPTNEDLKLYLKQHKDKTCQSMKAMFVNKEYQEYPNTQIRILSTKEIETYLLEQKV